MIIGAGQAGLAMSRQLTDAAVDHVVLERGVVANAWRTERWDSLALLTPNWMTRLPGCEGQTLNPDGYESAGELAQRLADFAASFDAPVHTGVEVTALTRAGDDFLVETSAGNWTCATAVIASGACSTPRIPALASKLPDHIEQLTPIRYRNPDSLADGGALVVGASASGLQLADEIAGSGRSVTLAVGSHTRIPRTYRGRDILWWGEEIGWLHETIADMGPDIDLVALRGRPSMQLIGTTEQRNLDLNGLRRRGALIAGRLVDIDAAHAHFDDSLATNSAAADRNMFELLGRIEKWIAQHGNEAGFDPADSPSPTHVGAGTEPLDLDTISTVIWATGFQPHLPWLDARWLDVNGAIEHEGGVVDSDGLYVLGLPFLRRRKSSFIDGVGPDSADLAELLIAALRRK